jgi:DNA-binding NtrC family response regulator
MTDAQAESSRRPTLVVVDDDPLIAETLSYVLDQDFDITTAATRPECIAMVRAMPQPPDLALVDLGLPPQPHRPDEGFALISDLLAHAPQMRILVLSGQSDADNARHARALGAAEFVAKPADPAQLRRLLLELLSFNRIDRAPAHAIEERCRLIGQSPAMRVLREQIRQYAESPFPVLIEGESGSGKEIVARCGLHSLTQRAELPYLAVNCAAISPTLLEPTLFGHAKGAFTGAAGARAGYFEDAGEGTLFLDEIGELPLDLQPKLLRVLENGEFQRVGETQLRVSRARVLAATNRDLRKEVKSGRFRADLYHRLSVFTISVPPLREMGGDRLLLLDHFRARFAAQAGQPPFRFSHAARELWQAYHFPGNVRELRNIVIRLTTKFPGREVGRDDLEAELDLLEDAPAQRPGAPQSSAELATLAAGHLQQRGQFSLDQTLRLWEQAYIDAALRLTHGNVSQAAKLLGINRTTLYNRMENLARDAQGPEGPARRSP